MRETWTFWGKHIMLCWRYVVGSRYVQKYKSSVFVQIEVINGDLVCPETSRKFPVTDGIPNMLLNEDEIWFFAIIDFHWFFLLSKWIWSSLAFSSSHKSFFTESHKIEERPWAPGAGTEAELRVIESTDTAWPSPEHKVQSLVIYWQAPLLVLGTQLHLEFRQYW